MLIRYKRLKYEFVLKKLQKVREEVSLDVKFDVRHQKRIFFLSVEPKITISAGLEQRFVIFTFLEYLLSVNTTEKYQMRTTKCRKPGK